MFCTSVGFYVAILNILELRSDIFNFTCFGTENVGEIMNENVPPGTQQPDL
jgi:hypothetical protein